ncbi:hypothetical protein EG329_005466 [Mollisiaceae sp. DMI_Dod_QoI]|nr:hypothetical protein EG329_005466 [Helotiales sp. DMI_Dod_QoI]
MASTSVNHIKPSRNPDHASSPHPIYGDTTIIIVASCPRFMTLAITTPRSPPSDVDFMPPTDRAFGRPPQREIRDVRSDDGIDRVNFQGAALPWKFLLQIASGVARG